MQEVNELLNRLGELEEAPLIWINKKVYDMAQEIERLKIDYQQANDIIVEQSKEIEKLKQELEEEKEKRDYYQAVVEHWE